ncbi:MAG: hypothetical protein UV80_C0011G0001 [Candidatus Peregrinibacteria bacterium GW2011_GWF2_43_17]|nr:MAG: hypothetical protein UV80_C0011G0001 [Candidatus Peregrinibacteria bacterium GW2011_GWF2_43_17]HAU39526.1 hypothetical protein [Candidatus Peregrinibacteria bacterium]
MTEPQPQQGKVKVVLSEQAQAGIYSNAVSVNVSSNEVVLDFGYLMPAGQERVVKVLQRVNMTHKTAESFLKVFQNAVLDFRNKQKEGK